MFNRESTPEERQALLPNTTLQDNFNIFGWLRRKYLEGSQEQEYKSELKTTINETLLEISNNIEKIKENRTNGTWVTLDNEECKAMINETNDLIKFVDHALEQDDSIADNDMYLYAVRFSDEFKNEHEQLKKTNRPSL